MKNITVQLETIPAHTADVTAPKPREVIAGLTFLSMLVAIMVFGLAI